MWHFLFSSSLDPDSDPLCMLLLVDFLMLRSREYQSLLQLYQDWEVKAAIKSWWVCLDLCVCRLVPINLTFVFAFQEHRNLSQLPNFAFSTALCHFFLSQQEDMNCEESNKQRHKADQMLQNALIMFPAGYWSPYVTPSNTLHQYSVNTYFLWLLFL